jgi:predicted nucleic acid-binding Zn ribbon protein
MPYYEFVCDKCNQIVELKLHIAAYTNIDKVDMTHAACGGKLVRKFSPPAIHL